MMIKQERRTELTVYKFSWPQGPVQSLNNGTASLTLNLFFNL